MMEHQAIPKKETELSMGLFPAIMDGGEHREITREAALALIQWAHHYGLDAWAGHVCYMYGTPYVTEKGALANASRDPRYRGYVCRYMEAGDAEETCLEVDDIAYICEVFVEGYREPVTEYGVVTKVELDTLRATVDANVLTALSGKAFSADLIERETRRRLALLPLTRNPSAQARARAIRRAHLNAFPLTPREAAGQEPTLPGPPHPA